MKRQPSGDVSKPSAVLPVVILLGALLASVPAGCSAVRLWRRLPARHVARVELPELEAAFERVNRAITPEAREGLALREASRTLSGALTNAVEPDQLQPTVTRAVSSLTRSQLGRLQLAAARMWLLEQRGEPIEDWWPSLHVFLVGLQRANFEHYQVALTQHWAAAYQAVGLGPGTAYELAEDLVGHPHGPFLEFFVPRLRRVVAERERAGDQAAAATCRRVLTGLLKQWVLEPGSAGLRLLAADLLAESLETGVGSEGVEAQAIAQDLRQWRSAYHEAARRRPVATLGVHRKPALAPAAHERLFARIGLMTWLGSATLTAGVVAILCVWSWVRQRQAATGRARLALCGFSAALIVTIGGVLWVHLRPDSIRADLRSDFSALYYWWRHPFVAAGLTLIVLLVMGRLQASASSVKRRFPARLGAAAAGTWLVLALMLWSCAWVGERARRDYELATRAAYQHPMEAVTGSDAESMLARLRRWEP
jgi:hypothetical protein